MITKTRLEAPAFTIDTCNQLHVRLSCHVLARYISIRLFVHMWRTEVIKFANIPEHNAMLACRKHGCMTPLILHFGARYKWRSRWRSCLTQYAASRKVADSIPDGVNEIVHLLNPSGRAMALESIQSLTEMSTRDISWAGGGGVNTAGA
jgi:hypothetical protein